MKDMNKTTLAKLAWRIISRSDSLLGTVLAAKYANRKSWWNTVNKTKTDVSDA